MAASGVLLNDVMHKLYKEEVQENLGLIVLDDKNSLSSIKRGLHNIISLSRAVGREDIIQLATEIEDLVTSREMETIAGIQRIRDRIEQVRKDIWQMVSIIQGPPIRQRRIVLEDYLGKKCSDIIDNLNLKGKDIRIEIDCKDIETDMENMKTIDMILVHLIRNSVDHGFKGMDSGRIWIKARMEAGSIFVVIKDDGLGIDRIRLDGARGDIDIAFAEGITSREEPGPISGRGLGLTIVKHRVESGGGSIDFIENMDMGTGFRIELPTTRSMDLKDPEGQGVRR